MMKQKVCIQCTMENFSGIGLPLEFQVPGFGLCMVVAYALSWKASVLDRELKLKPSFSVFVILIKVCSLSLVIPWLLDSPETVGSGVGWGPRLPRPRPWPLFGESAGEEFAFYVTIRSFCHVYRLYFCNVSFELRFTLLASEPDS